MFYLLFEKEVGIQERRKKQSRKKNNCLIYTVLPPKANILYGVQPKAMDIAYENIFFHWKCVIQQAEVSNPEALLLTYEVLHQIYSHENIFFFYRSV